MTSDGQRVARPRAGIRLTRRGRLLLVLAVLGALLFAFWLGSLRASLAATASAGVAASGDAVVLEPGQTLWEIARRRAPDADPRIAVHRIMVVNNLSGASVSAGQRILVPELG